MSLDLAVLDENGHVAKSIPIELEEHNALLNMIKPGALLYRMKDYYGDFEFAPHEFEPLMQEVELLSKTNIHSLEVFTKKLLPLIRYARSVDLSIVGIAD